MNKVLSLSIIAALALLVLYFLLGNTPIVSPQADNKIPEIDTESDLVQRELSDEIIVIDNAGSTDLEGHTPTTFRGSGTGLFLGDDLHPQFPEDAGLQAFVHFDIGTLPSMDTNGTVVLSSSFGRTEGDPLTSLGEISVMRVVSEGFSAALWDADPHVSVCTFVLQANQAFSCDVTASVLQAQEEGADHIRYRLRFDRNTDSDGQQDLLSFRHYDPNANFPGLFQLTYAPETAVEHEVYTVPITLYRVAESGALTSARTAENIRSRFVHSADLWRQAGVEFDVTIEDITLTPDQIARVQFGDIAGLLSASSDPDRLHGFYVGSLGTINGIAFSGNHFAVADETTVRGYRTVAHEIGHLFGLPHTQDSIGRLMYQGSDGHVLSREEIAQVRELLGGN